MTDILTDCVMQLLLGF